MFSASEDAAQTFNSLIDAAVDVCTGVKFIARQYVTTVTISSHYLFLMFYDTYWIHTLTEQACVKPNLLFIISLDPQNKTQNFTLKLSCIISTIANM